MTELHRRIEQVVSRELAKNLIPVKTAEGILVGDIKIVSEGHIKHIWRGDQLLYKEVSLNVAAIKIANLLAKKQNHIKVEAIYRADQEYGHWFTESQMLRAHYQRAVKNKNEIKADVLWARYVEARERTVQCKNATERLAAF
jgi:hypothetical protein